MTFLKLVALDDVVVFPGMPVTLPVDVGADTRVLLVPRRGAGYAKVGLDIDGDRFAELIVERYRIPSERIAVVPASIDLARFDPAAQCPGSWLDRLRDIQRASGEYQSGQAVCCVVAAEQRFDDDARVIVERWRQIEPRQCLAQRPAGDDPAAIQE